MGGGGAGGENAGEFFLETEGGFEGLTDFSIGLVSI